MAALTRNWDMRLHFEAGVEFVNARKLVENGNIEFETESVTDPIPAGTPHTGVDVFIRRGTIFLMVDDYLKVQHRLQSIYYRLEVLNPKVTA